MRFAKGIDLEIMKATFDNLYSMAGAAGVSGRLVPDRQIAILGKLVGMLEKALSRGPKSSSCTESLRKLNSKYRQNVGGSRRQTPNWSNQTHY